MTQDDPQIVGVREGDVLAGKYRIEKILGAGGMGVVVAAHHIQLDEKVAIKFLLPDALSNEEAVARFAREARAAVKIKSEHVARISDVGTLENGAPYMVMEFLEGGDLASWLHRHGPLPIEQATEFMLQACEALAESHGLGIVHRDLKPANLFCIRRADGLQSIKVLDFGISKVTTLGPTGPEMSMTRTTAVMGSPLYMSPEQMKSTREVDARTDIWAVGVVLYELLTGKPPFDGDTLAEVCVKAAVHPPPPIRDRRPEVPPSLEAVILKCLEKSRENRYQNVAELALALAPFAPKRSGASVERILRIIQAAGLSLAAEVPPASPPTEPEGAPKQETQAAWGQTRSGNNLGKTSLTVAVTLFVVAALGIAVFELPKLRRAPSQSAPTVVRATALNVQGASTVAAPVSATPPQPLPIPPEAEPPTVPASATGAVVTRKVPPAVVPSGTKNKSSNASGHGKVSPAPATNSVTSTAAQTPSLRTAKPNCDPNYTLDAEGHRHFKPECF